VYLEKESMLDNDDNTEVLATCDTPTQPGILKSEWYGIELHIPIEQSIDVHILPAFDLLGQLTSDGSTMLFPPIVQCTGTAVGTLKLSFDVHASDTHVDGLQIWYRNDTSGDWSKHDDTSLQYDKITNTRSVVASITHFTQYIQVLNLHDLKGDYIYHTISRKAVLEGGSDNPKRTIWNPYSEKKFIGNLTDTRIEVFARAAGTTTTSSTNTNSATLAPAVKQVTVGSIGTARARTAGNECPISTSFATYSIEEWLPPSPPLLILKLPVIAINQGYPITAAQIAICSDITSSNTPTSSSSSTALTAAPSSTLITTSSAEFVLWDTKVLGSGEFIIMRQERIKAGRKPRARFLRLKCPLLCKF
jgi:hypothetical protein